MYQYSFRVHDRFSRGIIDIRDSARSFLAPPPLSTPCSRSTRCCRLAFDAGTAPAAATTASPSATSATAARLPSPEVEAAAAAAAATQGEFHVELTPNPALSLPLQAYVIALIMSDLDANTAAVAIFMCSLTYRRAFSLPLPLSS